MKKDLKSFLKEKKFVTGIKVMVNFKRKSGGYSKIPAKRGTEVMKYSDVKTALRLQKEEIKSKMREWDEYQMGTISELDLKTL